MRPLTEKDYADAAEELNVPVNMIKAVVEVESSGKGFTPDGNPTLLFERHHFHRHTNGRYSAKYPSISNRKSGGYTRSGELDRFNLAASLDRQAAIKSASWGMFQILGSNFGICGYRSPEEFLAGMKSGESEHLKAFVSFIKANGLDRHLRSRNYAAFASGYNGPAYKKNSYDTKIRDKFQQLERQDKTDVGAMNVRDIQVRLTKLGINPGAIDGRMGPRTSAAIKEFQRKNGLEINGRITPEFAMALRRLT